jgi:hypothetical protein
LQSFAEQYYAEVQVNRELGPEDHNIMQKLMVHLVTNSPLNCTEAPADRAPRRGEWTHLRSRDAAAPPGRVRLYLSSQEEVERVYQALHGQVLGLGSDRIVIDVTNDVKDQPISGNSRRIAGVADGNP